MRNPGELVLTTGSQFSQMLQQTVRGYAGLLTNFRATAGQVSGPVKIVEMGAQLSQQGGSGLVLFSALISINLAVLNSLPLPLLDGWQMMMLAIQSYGGVRCPNGSKWPSCNPVFFCWWGSRLC